jgi:hypothetical protein
MYPCPVPAVFILVPGYRWINGYRFEKGRSPFFWKKPVVPVPFYPPPTYLPPYSVPRIRRPVKFKFQKFFSRFTSNQYPYQPKKNKNRKKNKKHKQKKQKHKKNTRVPVHVPETGTGMKRIRYSFKKKIVYP